MVSTSQCHGIARRIHIGLLHKQEALHQVQSSLVCHLISYPRATTNPKEPSAHCSFKFSNSEPFYPTPKPDFKEGCLMKAPKDMAFGRSSAKTTFRSAGTSLSSRPMMLQVIPTYSNVTVHLPRRNSRNRCQWRPHALATTTANHSSNRNTNESQ